MEITQRILATAIIACGISAHANAGVVDADALRAWITANETTTPPPPVTDPSTFKPLGIPGNWKFVWGDEFNGTTVDQSKWILNWFGVPGQVTQPVNSAELAAYDPRQCGLSGTGVLLMNAVKKAIVATSDNKTYQYATCFLNSYSKYETAYGAFEARMLMPGATATSLPYNWPAFWANGRHSTWPDHGENDIMENLSRGPVWHYHFRVPDINASGSVTAPATGWSNSWHTFGASWTPTTVSYYYDGRPVGTLQVADPNPKYFMLSYAISTEHGGALSVPQTQKVDWVRFYKPL